MRTPLVLALVAALAFPTTAAALSGPDGVSHSKVLVIGLDGVRWDVLRTVIADGGAPNLDRLGREGIAAPTLLPYTLPEAATISEVGWSTIATGVGPAKHGISGIFVNNDPRQSTKNGYLDFLARVEAARPELSTFLVSDWANIGQSKNGGPIFSGPVDARHALSAADTIVSYDANDREVADLASAYLREGNPDAGFVYLGLVDQVAHEVGSATPIYTDSIATTDVRVGQLLEAVRARPSFERERWTVIVTTDHGQRPLDYGTLLSHGLGSDLERTSFVIADGPGIREGVATDAPGVVDVAPTVLHQLGIATDPAWKLDGRSFVRTPPPPPPPAATAALRLRRGRPVLTIDARAGAEAPRIELISTELPRGVAVSRSRVLRASADGRAIPKRLIRISARRVEVLPPGGARRVTLRAGGDAAVVSRRLMRRLRRSGQIELRARAVEVSQ